jgi:hypothetical protein
VLFTRMTIWKFKPDQKEGFFAKLDEKILDRTTKGYRGYLKLQSDDAPNDVTILTLWESEDTLDASGRELFIVDEEGKAAFTSTSEDMMPFVVNPPTVRHLKLSAELRV